MANPISGVRVLELTTMITGPLAGQLLADLGASVIKVEAPNGGDPFRSHSGGTYGGHFLSYNRSKRSLTLDLKSSEGLQALKELVMKSDVLIENFRPGVLERLGLSDESLMSLNPRLIHASITGFGHDGPYRDRPSFDAVAQALSGVLAQFIDPAHPQPAGPTVSDNITGFYAAYAVLAALYQRERSGKGCRIDTSMLEATIAFAPDAFVNFQRHGSLAGQLSRVVVSQSYAFRCADGKLVVIHLSSPTKFWESLIDAIERSDLLSHPNFAKRQDRILNYERLRDELAKTFATRPRAEWAARLEAADVPYAPVYDAREVPSDPQINHLGTFQTLTHPVEGSVLSISSPVKFDGSRPSQMRAPPVLGEHTEEILRELGRSDQQIASLRSQKVI